MIGWGTVDLVEIIWTLTAVPGLIIWLRNWIFARGSLRAVRALHVGNGRLVWSRFSVLLTRSFFAIQTVFVLIGGVSMARPPNPAAAGWDWLRVLLTAGLLGAPLLISYVGHRWRRVDQEIVKLALARRRDPPEPERKPNRPAT